MQSRRDDPAIRRRPLPNNLYADPTPEASLNSPAHDQDPHSDSDSDPDADLRPPPLPLRPSRSVTNLYASSQHDFSPQQKDYATVDELFFLKSAEEVPPPPLPARPALRQAQTLLPETLHVPPPPLGLPEVRRVKSSSALSTASPTPRNNLSRTTTTNSTTSTTTTATKQPSKWKSALNEAHYFANGLLSKPAESTRHHSIIRHSPALIWYRGPSTSLTCTFLSDQPLPANRTLWLQQKGYSGNMGMSLKAMVGGAVGTASWLDVTPAREARAEHLPEMEERSVQRDLRRFGKRATGRVRRHLPRETWVVRVPAVAVDGYFRLVVCAGGSDNNNNNARGQDGGRKRMLCGSPVFRIASTTTDVAVVKGASLSTMPLEVGVKVASTIGQQVARRYTGVAGLLLESRARKMVIPVERVKQASKLARTGYHASGLGAAVNDSRARGRATSRYDSLVVAAAAAAAGVGEEDILNAPVSYVGADTGPDLPFPLKFDGKIVRGTDRSTLELGIPTANLADVPDAVKMRLDGVFVAWVSLGEGKSSLPERVWYEAIVTVAPPRNDIPRVTPKNAVSVHIIHEFPEDEATFFDARLKVLLMAYLHPPLAATSPPSLSTTPSFSSSFSSPSPTSSFTTTFDPNEAEENPNADILSQHLQDTATTLASLSRPAWSSPQDTIARMKTLKGERSFSQRLDDAAGRVQNQVDRLPLHWAGVRSESGVVRDRVYGRGGLWIRRDGGFAGA